MVFHMPTMLRTYGNLRQFSGQGKLELFSTYSSFEDVRFVEYV